MKCILAKKLEMSQIFDTSGVVVPVTMVQAGPCTVTQVKTQAKDGYAAIQLGFGTTKRVKKPQLGHLKDLPLHAHICEFHISGDPVQTRGETIEATIFQVGDIVTVRGTSKGKGFQGVVKRHGFAGHPTSHGHKDQARMPGSSGPGGLQHVMKGRRMGGHMGDEVVTVKNLRVVEIRDGGLLLIKGALPGARGSILQVSMT